MDKSPPPPSPPLTPGHSPEPEPETRETIEKTEDGDAFEATSPRSPIPLRTMDAPSAPGTPVLDDQKGESKEKRNRNGSTAQKPSSPLKTFEDEDLPPDDDTSLYVDNEKTANGVHARDPSGKTANEPSTSANPPANDDATIRRPRGGRKDRSKQQIESEEKKMNQRLNHQLNDRMKVKREERLQTLQQDVDEGDEDEEEEQDDDYSEENPERPESSRLRPRPAGKKPPTGVRAFNIRRAEASGGRPIGIPRPTVRVRRSSESAEGTDREGASSTERESEERRDVSIRIDLNLEIELFLKTKIKGDVTITFLS